MMDKKIYGQKMFSEANIHMTINTLQNLSQLWANVFFEWSPKSSSTTKHNTRRPSKKTQDHLRLYGQAVVLLFKIILQFTSESLTH